jgi:hypothetical protein
MGRQEEQLLIHRGRAQKTWYTRLVWSQLAEITTPPIVTTDFLYLGLIGDRSIQDKEFGRIQIDRVHELQKWVQDERIKLAIIAANNHYAGLGLEP